MLLESKTNSSWMAKAVRNGGRLTFTSKLRLTVSSHKAICKGSIPFAGIGDTMIETIGLTGSIMFGICIIPQVYQTIKTKSTKGINKYFLYTWLIGDILSIIYTIGISAFPLLYNYVPSLISVVILLYYYRKSNV